jgi:tetratricopeptide (TPR) repeat protein
VTKLIAEVTNMERQIVGSAPENEPFDERLTAIETKLFGGPQPGGLLQRVGRIASAMQKCNLTTGPLGQFGQPESKTPAQNDAVWPSDKPVSAPTGADKAIAKDPDSQAAAMTVPTASSIMPHAVPAKAEKKATSDLNTMEWPLDDDISKLAAATSAAVNKNLFLQGGVSDVVDATFQRMKKQPDNIVSAAASKAYAGGNYKLAKQLYDLLCARRPRDARNFYGSGMASQALAQSFDAFPDFVIAWHLEGNNPEYLKAADSTVQDMQKGVDWSFKLTYGFKPEQPEAVLNAGARCFKAGLVAQSMKLFEYALRNENPYRQVAAYNLGAVEESLGNPKVALTYYGWAAKEAARLQSLKTSLQAEHDVSAANSIQASLNIAGPELIGQAVADVQQKVLRGDITWRGWQQPKTLPDTNGSEICPLCLIGRTKPVPF